MRLLLLLLAGCCAWADTSRELLSGGLQAQLLDLNANSWVVGESCFDGCGTVLWSSPGPSTLEYYLLPAALDTVPLDLNDRNQVLIESSPELTGFFMPIDAILSLTGSAPACMWGPAGFEGQVGRWCAQNGAFIDPVVITDGFNSTSEWSLWSGDGLHTTNSRGQTIVECVTNCYDYHAASDIAGYLVTHRGQPASVGSVPEPASLWLLLVAALLTLFVTRDRMWL